MLLSPGAYLALGLLVVLLLSSLFTTDEIIASNGIEIGPQLAVDVAAAVSDGDVWLVVSELTPLYFVTILFAVISQILRPWVGDWWTMRTALRAGFYHITTLVCWIMLSSVLIDRIQVGANNTDLGVFLYTLNMIPMIAVSVWMYFWFFRRGGRIERWKAAGLTAAMVGAVLVLGVGTDLVLRFASG
jgi:hypothetical protein